MKRITRKQFIGALLLGGTTIAILKTLPKSLGEYYLALSRWNIDTLKVYAESILPKGDDWPSAETAEVYRRMDEELFFCSKSISSDLSDALLLIEWYPFFAGSFSRFSRLSTATATQIVSTGLTSENELVRAAFSNVRMLIFMMYYGHSSTFSKIGYDGPFLNWPEKLSEQRLYYAEEIK